MKSIRTKLTINVLIISLVAMAIITSISYIVSKKAIILESTNKFSNLTSLNSEKINTWFNEQSTVIKSTSRNLSNFSTIEDIKKIVIDQTEKNDTVIAFYAGFGDGSSIFGDGWIPDASYDATKRPWYKMAVTKAGETVFTEPYIDDLDGQIIVTASQLVSELNQKQTVLAMDFYLNLLGDILNTNNLPKNSYTFLTDAYGNIIYHTDQNYSPTKDGMKSINDINSYTNLSSEKDYNIIKDYDGYVRYLFKKHIPSTGWIVYTAVPKSQITTPSLIVLSSVIPVYLIISFLVILLTQIIVDKTIVKPINSLGLAMKNLAVGDLNIELNIKTEDELGMLSKDIILMVSVIKEMIEDLSIMSNKHQSGYSSYMIDDMEFNGAYKSVVTGINSMAVISNENFNELLNLMDKLDHGDFNAQIKDFHGEQSIGNKIVESLRNNLQNVNIEINHFVKATLSGQLSLRSDTEKFEGDWKEIMISLNKVMSSISEPINEVSNAIEQLSKGNLDTEITQECFGDFLVMKNAMNLSTKTLKNYINEISISLGKVADKDITYTLKGNYLGDFISIKDSINLINTTLKSVISEISQTSIGVDEGVGNLSKANETVATGALKQSTLLNQLTNNLSNISKESTKNVKTSNDAQNLFVVALNNLSEATSGMNQMLQSMENINSLSKDISDIIEVIEDIAFQTNLLALNAAVEAARAGSHGVGFAVVADEVRMLANRSQEAAKKSNELIHGSVEAVSIGMQKANSTSDSLNEINENIKRVSTLITLINSSSVKQNEDVSQAEISINKIESIAGINSNMAQENNYSSDELYNRTNDLTSMISKFKL